VWGYWAAANIAAACFWWGAELLGGFTGAVAAHSFGWGHGFGADGWASALAGFRNAI
jgi:hypothetical protein